MKKKKKGRNAEKTRRTTKNEKKKRGEQGREEEKHRSKGTLDFLGKLLSHTGLGPVRDNNFPKKSRGA